jgi:hypothetical protein
MTLTNLRTPAFVMVANTDHARREFHGRIRGGVARRAAQNGTTMSGRVNRSCRKPSTTCTLHPIRVAANNEELLVGGMQGVEAIDVGRKL